PADILRSLQKAQPGGNCHEQIGEGVGDAAGELSDRIDLLRMPDMLFGLGPFGQSLGYTLFEAFVEFSQLSLGGLSRRDVNGGADDTDALITPKNTSS